MGKRLITQRRGRGTPRYRSPSHRFKGRIKYPSAEWKETMGGQVVEIIGDPGRTAPIAKILLENFEEILAIAPEGLMVGQWIEIGENAKINNGNILPIGKIPEGTQVYNIEITPRDGGKLIRSSGTFGYVTSHEGGITYVKLPSKKTIIVNNKSRATVGRIAGGGRTDKPIAHAGSRYHAYKARGKLYPRVSGTSMNPVDHPHGGGSHGRIGKPATVSRNAAPGRKVGAIAAKRTGRKKRA